VTQPPREGRVSSYFGNPKMGKSVLARKHMRPKLGPGVLGIYFTPNPPHRDPFDFGPDMTVDQVRNCRHLPYALCLRGEDPAVVCQLAVDAATMPRLGPEGEPLEPFHVVLLVDESHEVFDHNFAKDSPTGVLFHRGRHVGIDLSSISQWPSRVDMRVFRASTNVHWFCLLAHADLRWVEREYGEAAAYDIATLKPWHCISVVDNRLPAGWQRYAVRDHAPETQPKKP
jgi:hypothetical protein